MKMFKALAAATMFGASMLAGGVAAAQTQASPAQTELANRVVDLMDLDEAITGMFDAMSPMMAASMGQELHLDSVRQARLSVLLAEEFRSATPEFMTRLAAVYATSLSEQQMRDTIAFLESPSGQAWLDTENRAQGQLEQMGQEIGMRVALQAMVRLNAENTGNNRRR